MESIVRELRWADGLDVALLAAFLYVIINWLRESASAGTFRRALAVFAVVGGAYALARVVGLFLVRSLVETLFVALLVIAVVVFQADIRRLIDRLGNWRKAWQGPAAEGGTSVTDIIREAAVEMAAMHRGALIVLRGAEPLERHVTEGVQLDGEVSVPLLVSLFNPSSPGHDGAVILRGDRIVRFGAHLPLPENLPDVSRHGGTRHAAAAGITEVSDALVVVVSEEQGAVRVAEAGRLTPIESGDELAERLRSFWDSHYSGSSDGQARRRRRRLQSAALALLIAVLSWMAFSYPPETRYPTYSVPVVMQGVPSDWSVEDPEPLTVLVTLKGSRSAFRVFDADALALTFDLSDVQEGRNELAVTEEALDLPPLVDLYNAQPRIVTVRARPMERVQVRVVVRSQGALADSLELVRLTVEPDSIPLLVPRDGRSVAEVGTELVELGPVVGDTTLTRLIVVPDEARLVAPEAAEVRVRVDVRRRQ